MKNSAQKISSLIFAVFVMLLSVVVNTSQTAVAAQVAVIPLIGDPTSASSSISPADVLELATTSISPDSTADVLRITPTASNAGIYTVPDGKYLVITSLTVFPQAPGTGNLYVNLIQNSSSRFYWVVPNAQPTELSFGPGMLIASGYSLDIKNWSSSAGPIRVSLHGYLTNQ